MGGVAGTESQKAELLGHYLQSVYWGRGYSGLDEAAGGYFGIAPAKLTPVASFFLVERLASPNEANPHRVASILDRSAISSVVFSGPDCLGGLVDVYESNFGVGESVWQLLAKSHNR